MNSPTTSEVVTLPRVIVSGLSGGAGKTLVSLGLCRAWARAGSIVQPFKKGPDYIDAAWLAIASRNPATNLDPFLFPRTSLLSLFFHASKGRDIAVIEGNRGLFDGKDEDGSASTAELARQLRCPLVLVMDITKMTRTAAAVVAGVKAFEKDLPLAGVILNRVAGERHKSLATRCIERDTGVPVLGALPKIPDNPIPERHMGLVGDRDLSSAEAILDRLADIVEEHCDVQRIREAAEAADPMEKPAEPFFLESEPAGSKVRIGVVKDEAFWFYYPENLKALELAGARLVEVDLLRTADWPDLHGLYIGGGFPELKAQELASNNTIRQRVRALAEMELPIYAECGGFMYLCRSLVVDGQEFPMAGVFPVRTELCVKPQGLGYVEGTVVAANPFHPEGSTIIGHEFHYSVCSAADGSVLNFALKMNRGQGILAGLDGLVYKNTWASYTHIHVVGEPQWAARFVAAAIEYRRAIERKPAGRSV
ncbi:cobyrinic acid a,c-diamide synthase [Oceanidesulfovibrio indonesiensis]|uniref:Cobyrinate a,c-diamide synthase n=1 Tax=Oceanidesulfovibrio indonesiensis TaxID=54767 RepID=A0A7M3MBF9_9BACT|nr:cobyrinate a,c-diamide synthase [Oceanidesulfovibrio indonesiensis]TVM15525.1 cobyrinic acid a,c-diamide synthase [Oceanidesulfovibrio indonesiensis]